MAKRLLFAAFALHLASGAWLLNQCIRTGIFLLLPGTSDLARVKLPQSLLQNLVIPSILVILASTAGTLALIASPTIRNDTDRRVLPLLLLAVQCSCIWITPIHSVAFGKATIGATIAETVYIACVIFAMTILLILAFTRVGINANKIAWYLSIGGAASLLVAMLVPKAGPVSTRMIDPGIGTPELAWTILGMGVFACIGFWFGYKKEHSRHNFIRALGMTILVIGIALVETQVSGSVSLGGSVLYLGGIILVAPAGLAEAL